MSILPYRGRRNKTRFALEIKRVALGGKSSVDLFESYQSNRGGTKEATAVACLRENPPGSSFNVQQMIIWGGLLKKLADWIYMMHVEVDCLMSAALLAHEPQMMCLFTVTNPERHDPKPNQKLSL